MPYNKKIKTYVITIAKQFPSDHICKGEPTYFREKIEAGEKIHTIRTNYDLWAKRIEEVQAGRALLSLRQWSVKPYNSKQVEIKQLTADDGVGIQLAELNMRGGVIIGNSTIDKSTVAKNDGLSVNEFDSWFRKVVPYQELALIHFTPFRYQDTDFAAMEEQIAKHSFLHTNNAK